MSDTPAYAHKAHTIRNMTASMQKREIAVSLPGKLAIDITLIDLLSTPMAHNHTALHEEVSLALAVFHEHFCAEHTL